MTRAIIVALVLAAAVGAARADTTRTNCRHSYYDGWTCVTRTTPTAPPIAPRQTTAEEERERAAAVEKWRAFCRPVVFTDEYNVPRYRYAHEGCDLGRDE